MHKKQVIETLEMENELICFNPLTGEEIPLEYVNDLNRNCYDAHQEAIRLINNSIPIEWIKEYAHKLIELERRKPVEYHMFSILGENILQMIHDWRDGNEPH